MRTEQHRRGRRWFLVEIGAFLLCACAAGRAPSTPSARTVQVASPTGWEVRDHAAVQAAFDAVEPGGEVRFAPGTYVLGRSVRLTVPDVTVLGHPDGTVLRGGAPEDFDVETFDEIRHLLLEHTGLEVRAERQTIRDLTFEYAWHGIFVGSLPDTVDELERGPPPDPLVGGHRIEGNTFRACSNGIRIASDGDGRTVVRDNDFVDTYHAIVINAGTVDFEDNRIRIEDPLRVPVAGHPGGPLIVAPDMASESGPHVIARNSIEGHPDGIEVFAWPGKRCSGIEIRDNTIRVARVDVPADWMTVTTTPDDRTVVGVPIRLVAHAARAEVPEPGVIEDVVVHGNRLLGSEGIGIELRRVSRCEVTANVIEGIRRRAPFPGNTLDADPAAWETANGAAIWISPGSDGNVVANNEIEDVEADAIVVEGSGNRIEVARDASSVRDLGADNELVLAAAPERDAFRLPESRFAHANGVRLEYFAFGSAGVPLVFVQDHHDYFRLEEAESMVEFLGRFGDAFRVLAPVRRGWGRSEDPGSGYDVETQAEDLLGLLDALGIERALFVGRTMATQEMLWIAEHRPERVLALAFLGTPLVALPDAHDPEVERFGRMYARNSSDIGSGDDVDRRLRPREDWRPRFVDDPDARVDVRALLVLHPVFDRISFSLRRLEKVERWEPEHDAWWSDPEAREYVLALRQDEERLAALRRALTERKPKARIQAALERAFGDRMTVVWEGDGLPDDGPFDEWYRILRPFLEDVAAHGAAAPSSR